MYQIIPQYFSLPIFNNIKEVLQTNLIYPQEYNFNSKYLDIIRKEVVVGVSLPSLRETRWIRDKELMEKYAKERGVIIKVENADTNVKLQAEQVDNLISQGINALIIAPTDFIATAPIVEKAKKSGIKVIAYDRLIFSNDIDLYISTDNMKVGEFQGRYLVGNVPKGNYVVMSGDPNDDNSMLFKEGAMEYIRPLVFNRDIRIVSEQAIINWDPQNAYNIVRNALSAYKNKINAILAPNDNTAGGAIRALEEEGLDGKVPVTGQDADLPAIKRILKGTQSMTVLKDNRQLCELTIDSAIKLVNEQSIDVNSKVYNGKKIVPAILTLPVFVSKNNIDDTIIKSGYWTKDEIYKP